MCAELEILFQIRRRCRWCAVAYVAMHSVCVCALCLLILCVAVGVLGVCLYCSMRGHVCVRLNDHGLSEVCCPVRPVLFTGKPL